MSRIREALSKVESERRRPPGYEPEVSEPKPVERAPFEPKIAAYAPPPAPAYAPVPEPVTAPAPMVAPEPPALAYDEEPLPGIPSDFQRELATLRSTLESALPGRPTRVVLFAAAVSGEGTTTVAANFARVLAQDPTQSVLYVDANVRRPNGSLFFGLPEGPGLRELALARGAADFDRAVQAVERHNLHVLTAHAATGDTAHLFAVDAVREFWARFGPRYHWIVLDAAPVLEAPETPLLGSTVDTTVFVVQAARTKRGVVQRAMDKCAKANAPVLGVVLNRRRLDIPEFIYRRI
jgi:Mrp family chromosome partitioning ATPase